MINIDNLLNFAESENENGKKNSEEVNLDENCDCHSLGSWNDGVQGNSASEVPSPRMSWADMAQEDDEFGEDEIGIGIDQNDESAVVGGIVLGENSGENRVVADKAVLPREQREYIRFMNVRRKKDFICMERINGKLVNIVEGLELHTGIFSAAEQKRIVGYVASLQEMGRKGELKGLHFSTFMLS